MNLPTKPGWYVRSNNGVDLLTQIARDRDGRLVLESSMCPLIAIVGWDWLGPFDIDDVRHGMALRPVREREARERAEVSE